MNKEQQLVTQAQNMFDRNLHAEALSLLEEAVSINPENPKAFFYMGNIFHLKGQLGKAINSFKKVIELDPSFTDAAISLSVILNDIGRYEEAQKIFEQANKKVKSNTQGVQDPGINRQFALKHLEIAEMYFSYNRYDEALFEYNKAIALDSENIAVRVKVAKVYSKKGFISKAVDELRSIKSEYPNYIPARVALGLLYYSGGNALEAQNEWQTALQKDPTNTELQMYLELSQSATETNLR